MTEATTKASDSHQVHRKIRSASYLLMSSIILSRIIGFFREWILAKTVGANDLTDVYYASFTIPDILNYLTAAGAMSISFIPLLSQYVAEGKKDFGNLVFRYLSTVMGSILVISIVIAEIFARPLSQLIAPGFSPSQIDLLTMLIRIILPAQFFFYWGGLCISVQQTFGVFWYAALAPIIYNSGIILLGLLLHSQFGIMGFSLGVLAGAFVGHGVLQTMGIYKVGFSIKPLFKVEPAVHAELKRYFKLTLPIMLGFSIVVTDEWITKFLASFIQGPAISWLNYARTEMRIPIAVIGQAAGVASFPFLTRLWNEKRLSEFIELLSREILILWALAPLAAIIMITHALPLTHFIYGGGKMTPLDLQNTASTLQMYSFGIFFWTLQVLLARGFYAAQKTWIPPVLGGICSALTIPIYYFLFHTFSFEGLAAASSISIALYCLMLGFFLRKYIAKQGISLNVKKMLPFISIWSVFLVAFYFISEGFLKLNIYHQTQMSGFLDLACVGTVILALAVGALKFLIPKWTGHKLL